MSGTLDHMALAEENAELREKLRKLHARDLETHKRAIQHLHKQKMDRALAVTINISKIVFKVLLAICAIALIGFIGASINNTFLHARLQHEQMYCENSCRDKYGPKYSSTHIKFRLSDNSDCYCSYLDGSATIIELHETIPM